MCETAWLESSRRRVTRVNNTVTRVNNTSGGPASSFRRLVLSGVLCLAAVSGCGGSDDAKRGDGAGDSERVAENGADEVNDAAEVNGADAKKEGVGASDTVDANEPASDRDASAMRNGSADSRSGAASEMLPPVAGEPDSPGEPPQDGAVDSGYRVAAEPSDAISGDREPSRRLREDLTPDELGTFLGEADRQMRRIASGEAGIMDEGEALAKMREVIEQKLEASRQLRNHPTADTAQQAEGLRGELQSLSHLASLGDLSAAESLEQLANEHLDSDHPSVRVDSRMVRLGFAIETLRHGSEGAAEEIVDQAQDLASEADGANLPAMVVMAQAREVLEQYGYDDQARAVRATIIEHFADSDDPNIARMAADMAGSVRYDAIEPARAAAVAGEDVDVESWSEKVATLIESSPDIMTVRYLAGAALELEGAGRDALADATYEQLEENFSDPSVARDREAQMAIEARDARRSVIGRPFDPDLTSVTGDPLPFDEYRGRVVLMPFWGSRFPDSLQLLSRLLRIREAHPESVAIVGMNLDPEETSPAELRQFAEQSGIDFPSYRSPSSATARVANEVAQRFGLVSMPFTVIIDPEGRVAAIDLTGNTLEETVEDLVDD